MTTQQRTVSCRGCGSPNQIDPIAVRWNCSVCRWLHRVDTNGASNSVVDIAKANQTRHKRSSRTWRGAKQGMFDKKPEVR